MGHPACTTLLIKARRSSRATMEQEITRLTEQFGGGLGLRAYHLATLPLTGQPCDVSFIEKKRAAVDVTNDQGFRWLACKDGARAPRNLEEILKSDSRTNRWLAACRYPARSSHASRRVVERRAWQRLIFLTGDRNLAERRDGADEIVRTFYRCESGEDGGWISPELARLLKSNGEVNGIRRRFGS